MSGTPKSSPEQLALIRWVARIGAVTADALSVRDQLSAASARGRLQALERRGLLVRSRPLHGSPALYVVTRAGLREAGVRGVEPMTVSASNARHAGCCADAAATLERLYPSHWVMGERELRREEREARATLASATLGVDADGVRLLHRPDLVLWSGSGQGRPLAVEVELTVKAPRRLAEICIAWARCRVVSGVLYVVSDEVRRPLERAVTDAQAENVVLVPLEYLRTTVKAPERTITPRA